MTTMTEDNIIQTAPEQGGDLPTPNDETQLVPENTATPDEYIRIDVC